MEDKKLIIKCPVCGQEYLPSEIFYPDDFLGKSFNVVKDDDGKIIYFDGNNMNLNETYICDKCGSVLIIKADVGFDVTTETKKDEFDEDYVTKIV